MKKCLTTQFKKAIRKINENVHCLIQINSQPEGLVMGEIFERKVNDSIAAVNQEMVQKILHQYNNFNKHIQFTIQKEQTNKINVLDLKPQHN